MIAFPTCKDAGVTTRIRRADEDGVFMSDGLHLSEAEHVLCFDLLAT